MLPQNLTKYFQITLRILSFILTGLTVCYIRDSWKLLDQNSLEFPLPNWSVLYYGILSDRETLDTSTDHWNHWNFQIVLNYSALVTSLVIFRLLNNAFLLFFLMLCDAVSQKILKEKTIKRHIIVGNPQG